LIRTNFSLRFVKIMDMEYDYNTSRPKLILPEYGRNIQKMVEHILTIGDREERNRLAQAVIIIMGNMNPHLRDINDFKHKLWDHLAIMSDFQLDIDYPYEIPQPEEFAEKPRRVSYNTNEIRYRHYGRIVESLIKEAIKLPEGEDKDTLTKLIANHMKKSYLAWNRDSVTDEIIFNDLYELSGKKLTVKEGLKLSDQKDFQKGKQQQQQQRKRMQMQQQRKKPQ
jgi:molybdopterin converting factor small subunit